jgi:HEAT repeat protein
MPQLFRRCGSAAANEALVRRERKKMKWRWWACGFLVLALLWGSAPPAAGAPPLSNAGPALDEMGKRIEDQSLPAAERLEIIGVLGQWATAQARPPLVAVLKDPLPEIRAAAARALGWPGNNDAVPALRERIETPGEAAVVRAAAVGSLGRIGDRAVRALVITATSDPDMSVRTAALASVTFGSLADPADRTAYLMRVAEDRALEAQLRAAAVRALGSVKAEGVVESLTRILEHEPRMTIALPPGQPTELQVMTLRYAQARDVAGWTASALGQLEARSALPLLLRTAEDPNDFFLRQMSIWTLVAWNVPEAFPVLVRRLEDPLADNRILALGGLARLGDRQAVDPVLARLSDQSAPVRAQAVKTLGALGDPKVRQPLEALQQTESDPDVLGALEDELARPVR